MNSIFQALSSPPRRLILAYLSKATLTAGDIANRFDMSKPAVSKHLSVLENAGLVQREKKGMYVVYSLNKENLFAGLNDFLVDFCPEGRPLKIEGMGLNDTKEDKDS